MLHSLVQPCSAFPLAIAFDSEANYLNVLEPMLIVLSLELQDDSVHVH
jgi:hypothetical protein